MEGAQKALDALVTLVADEKRGDTRPGYQAVLVQRYADLLFCLVDPRRERQSGGWLHYVDGRLGSFLNGPEDDPMRQLAADFAWLVQSTGEIQRRSYVYDAESAQLVLQADATRLWPDRCVFDMREGKRPVVAIPGRNPVQRPLDVVVGRPRRIDEAHEEPMLDVPVALAFAALNERVLTSDVSDFMASNSQVGDVAGRTRRPRLLRDQFDRLCRRLVDERTTRFPLKGERVERGTMEGWSLRYVQPRKPILLWTDDDSQRSQLLRAMVERYQKREKPANPYSVFDVVS
jgi:hypothetical protein